MKRFFQKFKDYILLAGMAVMVCASIYTASFAMGGLPGPQGGSPGVSLAGTNTWTAPQSITISGTSQPLALQNASNSSNDSVLTCVSSIGTVLKIRCDGVVQFNNNSVEINNSTIQDNSGSRYKISSSGIILDTASKVTWGSGNNGSTQDIGIARNAAGVVEINNGTAGGTGALKFNGYAVNSLPTGSIGMVACVTDALAPVVGSTVVNGGSAKALVWWNGSAWKVLAV